MPVHSSVADVPLPHQSTLAPPPSPVPKKDALRRRTWKIFKSFHPFLSTKGKTATDDDDTEHNSDEDIDFCANPSPSSVPRNRSRTLSHMPLSPSSRTASTGHADYYFHGQHAFGMPAGSDAVYAYHNNNNPNNNNSGRSPRPKYGHRSKLSDVTIGDATLRANHMLWGEPQSKPILHTKRSVENHKSKAKCGNSSNAHKRMGRADLVPGITSVVQGAPPSPLLIDDIPSLLWPINRPASPPLPTSAKHNRHQLHQLDDHQPVSLAPAPRPSRSRTQTTSNSTPTSSRRPSHLSLSPMTATIPPSPRTPTKKRAITPTSTSSSTSNSPSNSSKFSSTSTASASASASVSATTPPSSAQASIDSFFMSIRSREDDETSSTLEVSPHPTGIRRFVSMESLGTRAVLSKLKQKEKPAAMAVHHHHHRQASKFSQDEVLDDDNLPQHHELPEQQQQQQQQQRQPRWTMGAAAQAHVRQIQQQQQQQQQQRRQKSSHETIIGLPQRPDRTNSLSSTCTFGRSSQPQPFSHGHTQSYVLRGRSSVPPPAAPATAATATASSSSILGHPFHTRDSFDVELRLSSRTSLFSDDADADAERSALGHAHRGEWSMDRSCSPYPFPLSGSPDRHLDDEEGEGEAEEGRGRVEYAYPIR
ncbi:unnamed protein product, partial [Tilletia controversa]